jgi:hypothetical protein
MHNKTAGITAFLFVASTANTDTAPGREWKMHIEVAASIPHDSGAGS